MADGNHTTGSPVVTGMATAGLWSCPKCGQTVRTLVATRTPWCAGHKHGRKPVAMVRSSK